MKIHYFDNGLLINIYNDAIIFNGYNTSPKIINYIICTRKTSISAIWILFIILAGKNEHISPV